MEKMMTDVDVEISMFERVGGTVTIDRLVEIFYERMDVLPEEQGIRTMHQADLGVNPKRAQALSLRMDGRTKTLFC
jgi:truncated hemoglobin YjbI